MRRRRNFETWEREKILDLIEQHGCVVVSKMIDRPYPTVFGIYRQSDRWQQGKLYEFAASPCSAAERAKEAISSDPACLAWVEPDAFDKSDRLHPAIDRFFDALAAEIEGRGY